MNYSSRMVKGRRELRRGFALFMVFAFAVVNSCSGIPLDSSPGKEAGEAESPSFLEQSGVVLLIGVLYLGKVLAFVFTDVPRTVFLEFPYWAFYKAPSGILQSCKGIPAKVNTLVERLEGEGISLQEEKEIMDELESLTGLFMEGKEEWIQWWKSCCTRKPEEWRREYIRKALEGLSSDDFWERSLSIERLIKITGRNFGYDANDPPESREEARNLWMKWWKEEEGEE